MLLNTSMIGGPGIGGVAKNIIYRNLWDIL